MTIKAIYQILTAVIAFQIISLAVFAQQAARVLIFSKTTGYHHHSISSGITAIKKLGLTNGFTVDATKDVTWFTFQKLKQYKAIVFLNPTGDHFFNPEQKAAFQQYIRNGGNFVGIHSATDCLYSWEWYGKLVGAYFLSHPKIQPAKLLIVNKEHPATKYLASVWMHKDEWYNLKAINPAIKVLINLDETSYQGGQNGKLHPISWYHTFEGGRVFYTGLGHRKKTYNNPDFLQHLLGGIQYCIGVK